MIRQARRGDAETVASLVARFFAEEGFATPSADVAVRAERFLAEPANAAFLAFVGDTAVGVATVTTAFGFETGAYAELEDLYVLPDHRGRGLATGLIEAVARWCEARGCSDVEVVVTPEGDDARGLGAWYRSLGFDDTGRRILELRLR